jgi:hypothetical protein
MNEDTKSERRKEEADGQKEKMKGWSKKEIGRHKDDKEKEG